MVTRELATHQQSALELDDYEGMGGVIWVWAWQFEMHELIAFRLMKQTGRRARQFPGGFDLLLFI